MCILFETVMKLTTVLRYSEYRIFFLFSKWSHWNNGEHDWRRNILSYHIDYQLYKCVSVQSTYPMITIPAHSVRWNVRSISQQNVSAINDYLSLVLFPRRFRANRRIAFECVCMCMRMGFTHCHSLRLHQRDQ